MENFAQLLEEYSAVQEMNQGEVITAEVVAIEDKFVIVNAGLKSESLIDISEFKNAQGEVEVKVGDFVTVTIESVENGFGEIIFRELFLKRIQQCRFFFGNGKSLFSQIDRGLNELLHGEFAVF